MTKSLSTMMTSDTCIRFGEVVNKADLRVLPATHQDGTVITDAYTLREFVDEVFFQQHRVKLPIFGRDNGKANGTELTALTKEMGLNAGKREVAYFDKKLGGFLADWVNLYPFEVLNAWITAKTDGEYPVDSSF